MRSQEYVILDVVCTSAPDFFYQAAVAGTVIATQAFLNRDKRDALSPEEKSYLNDSFLYTGGGLTLTAIAARALFMNGTAFRIMSANPCELH